MPTLTVSKHAYAILKTWKDKLAKEPTFAGITISFSMVIENIEKENRILKETLERLGESRKQ